MVLNVRNNCKVKVKLTISLVLGLCTPESIINQQNYQLCYEIFELPDRQETIKSNELSENSQKIDKSSKWCRIISDRIIILSILL